MKTSLDKLTYKGQIDWKVALEQDIIKKQQLLTKVAKGFIYGESEGKIEYRKDNKIYYEIIVDDDWFYEKLKYTVYRYCSDKTSLKKAIDASWMDPKKQKLIDGIENLKKLAQEQGLDLKDLINES